jgi:hypothetical protein
MALQDKAARRVGRDVEPALDSAAAVGRNGLPI